MAMQPEARAAYIPNQRDQESTGVNTPRRRIVEPVTRIVSSVRNRFRSENVEGEQPPHKDTPHFLRASLLPEDNFVPVPSTFVPATVPERIIGENFYGLSDVDGQAAEHGQNGKEPIPDFGAEQEVRVSWRHRSITPEDVDRMLDEGWFDDWNRVRHLKGDTINRKTLADKDQLKTLMHEFYFPGGPFVIRAFDGDGNHIRDAVVERRTLVAEKDGELAGVTSWLEGVAVDENGKPTGEKATGDPWSKTDEPLSSHTQMHLVKTEFSGQGVGLFLAVARADAIFQAGYEQIVSWVNVIGNYQVNERMFYKLGADDRGKLYLNPTDPDKSLYMRQYVLDRDTYFEGGVRPDPDNEGLVEVGRNAAIARVKKKQRGLTLHEPNMG